MRRLLTFLLLLAAATASARVISYAPYSDSLSTPGVQNRLNRHFVLFETPITGGGYSNVGQVVVYDTLGLEEPRVALSNVAVISMAAREDDQQFAILVQVASPSAGMLSVDGGRTWKNLTLPASLSFTNILYPSYPDTGGPIARGRYAQVRIGTRQYPFYFSSSSPLGVFAIAQDGSIRTLFTGTLLFPTQQTSVRLLGTSADGSSVLFTTGRDVVSIDANGTLRSYGTLPAAPGGGSAAIGAVEGWIAPDGGAYVEQYLATNNAALYYLKNGTLTFVAGNANNSLGFPPPTTIPGTFYAVPAGDYNGAWMILRDASKSTILLSHVPNGTVVQRWEDITAPEVEAIIAAKSNTKVLIQVHRPRLTLDQLTFKDPAIAVWHVGDPAPKSYDELFLSETFAKGFVHVDVDKVESGDPFVFDSGGIASSFPSPILSPAPPSAGGSDVVQEWGVVRASLAQRLVLPGVGRTSGAFGSFWQTDVTFYNPSDQPQTIQIHYAANGNPLTIAAENTRTVSLAPFEIRTIADVLKNLFLFESGGGALYIVPAPGNGVNVTSRTYSTSANGTYGFGMNAIDVFAAASPRFPVTFSGAFLGPNFRTNLVITDVSGRGSEAALAGWGAFGPAGNDFTTYSVAPLGQQQFNFVNAAMGVGAGDTGALVVTPTRGEAVATLFVVDNRTNDSTFFPPDIPASVVRIIPAIGHLDGANGSKFRSDLYLFNHADTAKTLTLQAKVWDSSDPVAAIPLTLLPHEARVIPDVLKTAFNKSGIARLRYFQQGSSADTSVRVTSRTYTIDDNGGTYGFLMPPLNSFQSGSPGDTLEILGTSLDKRFRTNLGLVDLTPFSGNRPSRAKVTIVDDHGQTLDSFEITLPGLGGNQLNDLFHVRNLPESATPVLLRVTVIEGSVGAYAAVVDNGTNDPAYFAANLAAKQ